jgi:phage-related tail protein
MDFRTLNKTFDAAVHESMRRK